MVRVYSDHTTASFVHSKFQKQSKLAVTEILIVVLLQILKKENEDQNVLIGQLLHSQQDIRMAIEPDFVLKGM